MKMPLLLHWILNLGSVFLIVLIFSYRPIEKSDEPNKLEIAEKGLFDNDDIFSITLKGDIKGLVNDRLKKPKKFPMEMAYIKENSSEATLPVEVRTRGHFRRRKGICYYPPLLIDFPKVGPHHSTIFSEQKKTKLVMPCAGDEYVVREWLVYKLYNLITPKSFRARLVKVKLEDVKNKKSSSPQYGILLEEEKQMAGRNNMIIIESKMKPHQTKLNDFLTMAVFQYLIGNTDWSVQYFQNIKLVATNSTDIPTTVPYDFDHAGIVDAPYAKPAEELQMTSIRQRRYRGYCMENLQLFDSVIVHYNRLKDDIYKLYTSCTLLDAKYIKSTTQYLDDFYKTINNPKAWQKDFAYPCDKNGTGNVVIKGLKED
jgi:hypothetical protein